MIFPRTQPVHAWDVYRTGSQAAPTVAEIVSDAMQTFTRLWWACDPVLPETQRLRSQAEQTAAEKEMDRFSQTVQDALKELPATAAGQQAIRQRLLPEACRTAKTVFDLQDAHLDALQIDEFAETATQFVRQARRFDPQLSFADIYQAARNVITTNMLQRLWGMPVTMNQALFAYSMLYPYTDNYLDDPALSGAQKLDFSRRFSQRLEGAAVRPANAHEAQIFGLVAMIEAEYDRRLYPQVFHSLLAIQHAQTRSLALLNPGAAPYTLDVIGISLEKGGTSTLADGYLAAGDLTPRQAEFAFGLGAFLQLGDDLEDVLVDRKAGIQTVFSQVAGRWPLDALTNRTMHFGLHVFDLLDDLGTSPVLCEFVRQCTFQPFVTAVHRAHKFYTRPYLRQIEQRSAFRYRHLEKQARWLHRQQRGLLAAVEGFLLNADGRSGEE
ncbi:MAG: hypothetical protein ACOYYS_23980 [Chloroflexota bacterium]